MGGVQPGPDGTDFGAGQDYGFGLGAQLRQNADVALVLGWVNARESQTAIETDITSAGLRGRAWLGANRWSGYAEAGIRGYLLRVEIPPVTETDPHIGGELGAGVFYSRSSWWLGAGGSLHTMIGSSGFESGNLFTYMSYHVSIGGPMGW